MCDLDHAKEGSYLDPIRNLNLKWKIPLNTILILLFLSYGGIIPKW